VRASTADVLESLRQESRATTARNGLRSTLVAIQVALSLVLLIGTGLFSRSLVNVVREPLGFDVAHVATASVNLGAARYSAARAATFYDAALDRARALPGVTAAAWSTLVPINGSRVYTATIDGYQPRDTKDETYFYTSAAGPDYFVAAGTRILKGRAFSTDDTGTAPLVAIINSSAARKYWSGRNPLDGRVRLDDTHWIQIVGVAEDARIQDLDEEPSPYIYLPFAQESQGAPLDPVHLFVRTSGDEAALLGPLRDVLRAIDTDAPIYDVSTFAWRVRELAMPQRMGGMLFAAFSALALLLATIGIYGVASYVAALRTREIGIRIALGADRAGIRSLILRQGAPPIVAGMACGLMLSLFGSRLAASFFRGITPHDPATYIAVMVLLGIVALASTWLPARRAARQNPLSALRSD
jgi:predicted permease